jgi:demethylspheroidene O-methyltransferase
MHSHTIATQNNANSSFADRWFDWRNRLLMSRKFQRFAARFPLTRGYANHNARIAFDVVAGFVYSQVLLACTQLKLFDLLADGAKPLSWIAAQTELSEEAAQRLMDAAVSLRLFQARSGNRYGLGLIGAPLVGNKPVLAMIEHHRTLYADLRDPVALLRRRSFDTAMAQYWPYTPVSQAQDSDAQIKAQVAAYSALMVSSQPFVADEVLQLVSFSTTHRVLDVGGGEGEFASRLAHQYSKLEVTVFDLPAVAQRARNRFVNAGLAPRINAVGGSFLNDPLPRDHDTVVLMRVMHDHDDPEAIALLTAVFKALPVGGRLVVAEPMADTHGAQAMGHAYFGMYLWAMGRGRSRSSVALQQLLKNAGFSSVQEIKTQVPLQAGILVAKKK